MKNTHSPRRFGFKGSVGEMPALVLQSLRQAQVFSIPT